ncbi:hypothetical protein ACFPVY_04020 [Flavobacterium qiangtangense]|uniref:Uncharacterized protein n=1 Tax=Flavobacterium qiangtangense TaxID=1442595 RepID=A0ABW1PJJ6_9FLAO
MITYSDIILSGSPFYITYTAATTDFDYITIELWVWDGLVLSKPVLPTYTLTSSRATADQQTVYANIQDYISDYLDPIPSPFWFNSAQANLIDCKEFVHVQWKVQSWKRTPGEADLLFQEYESPRAMATLGYGYYDQGSNPQLSSQDVVKGGVKYKVEGMNTYYAKISNFQQQGTADMLTRFTDNTGKISCPGINKPYQVLFLNKNGIMDAFNFPKASKRNIKFSGEKYSVLPTHPYNHDIRRHTTILQNRNGKVVWEFNTDLLDESNVYLIEELLASSRHWLADYENERFIPLTLTDDDFEEKSSVRNMAKMQYTVKFEQAAEYINNVK